MQFIDLKRQYAVLKEGIDRSIAAVLAHGRFILGPEVSALEDALASLAGVRHAISCASGTDALLMPLMAWEIRAGDAVFVPAFTFFASAECRRACRRHTGIYRYMPRYIQYGPGFPGNGRPRDYRRRQAEAPGRHARGPIRLARRLRRHRAIARRYGLAVLEDAAQGLGADTTAGWRGAWGMRGPLPFSRRSPGMLRDGGAIFTDDDETAQVLRSIRVHGEGRDRYENVRLGLNGRLDSIQAAVLLQKLTIFEIEIEMRNDIALKYNERLAGAVKIPGFHEGLVSTWAQYSALAEDEAQRQDILEALTGADIPRPSITVSPCTGRRPLPIWGMGKGISRYRRI